MYFRQFPERRNGLRLLSLRLQDAGEPAVVDAHIDLVDAYIAGAEVQGSTIAAVMETHVQADHLLARQFPKPSPLNRGCGVTSAFA